MNHKPAFWHTFAIYLLLYNNGLIIYSLILSLQAIINGNIFFNLAILYQITVFFIYLIVIIGLILGKKRGYFVCLGFLPFIFLLFIYPPIIVTQLPYPFIIACHLIELGSCLYILLSPSSRNYYKAN